MTKEMLEKKIIVAPSSPWASFNVSLKKDSFIQLCAGYRRLNAITKCDPVALPQIDAALDIMKGACWISTLIYHPGVDKQENGLRTERKLHLSFRMCSMNLKRYLWIN